jgi:hypothetical protein
MKAVCKICERIFELTKTDDRNKVFADGGGPIYIVPQHPPLKGRASRKFSNAQTGEVIGEMCDGSLRPPQDIVH